MPAATRMTKEYWLEHQMMSKSMKIERVLQVDFPEIVEVWEASVRATHDFLTEADILYFKPLILNEYLKAVELFCVRENGVILGFLGLSSEKIEMLFVRPDAFGKGIGKQLLQFAVREKGVTEVDVNEQNPQAVGFYKHLGFEVVSRSPLDPQGKPFPILTMKLHADRDYLAVNRASWNWRAGQHFRSEFYDIKGFLAGKNSLNEIEINLLGDVRGKTVLHLQCHFGQDTLSLARLGAKAFGVDLSDEAIRKAGELNAKLGLDTEFICCDVYDLPNRLDRKFDVVFTSYGVLGWLPDMDRWASVVGHFLEPGGLFVLAEFHPVVWMFDEHFAKIGYAYDSPEPIIETVGTYTDTTDDSQFETVSWNHGLGDVVSSLVRHGVAIDQLTEYDYTPYDIFSNAIESEPGKFRVHDGKIPLTYSIKGHKQ